MDNKGYILFICEYDENQAIAVVNFPDENNSTLMMCEKHLLNSGWIIFKVEQGIYIHVYKEEK